jgi:hypothetical protein
MGWLDNLINRSPLCPRTELTLNCSYSCPSLLNSTTIPKILSGSLTGLVPAMYLDKDGQVVPSCPDDAAGLYIQARSGERVQVRLPPDACGFQIGETSQIQSGGLLQATPHAVLPARRQYDDGRMITREAFAVFLEPEFDAPLAIPAGKTVEDCQRVTAKLPASVLPVKARWQPFQTFGDFHIATVTAFATN